MNSRPMAAFCVAMSLAMPAVPATPSTPQVRAEAIRAHMRFLADDLLEGRGTASRGYDIAARYVATQFALAGLSPGAGDSYLQNVPLRSLRVDEAGSSLSFVRAGAPVQLEYVKDFLLRPDAGRARSQVSAPVVFVGFGITAPAQHYDDYAGLDVRGKIVALLLGAPPWESALKAHYSTSLIKYRNAVEHGAVGLILLNDPVLEKLYPYAQRIRDRNTPSLRWLESADKPHNYYPQLAGAAMLSTDATHRLFEGTPYSAEQIFAAARAGKPPAFEIPNLSVSIQTATRSQEASSENVVGLLPGSDPTLAREYVVFSAHLDHLGVGEPEHGDAIYNGALDNASGTAILIEAARVFAARHPRPRRSLLFVAVTGEEAGLIGSDYFANRPTVDKSALVADINVDEDPMLWPMRNVVAYGAEHSSLAADVKAAAASLHIAVSPDPAPEQVTFVRSDQYSFVQQGIPSVMPVPGFKSTDPAVDPPARWKEWERTRYHRAGDDMNQPYLDFGAAAVFAQLVCLIGESVADAPQRPHWNAHDFFGEQFGAKAGSGAR